MFGDGDGFVRCACGARHWGRYGAAGLLLSDPGRGVLLQRRAWWTHRGSTWALPGGAMRPGETPAQAATRETEEEADVPAEAVRPLASRSVDHGTWSYTTVLGTLAWKHGVVRPRVANAESSALEWVPPDEVESYALLADFAAVWPSLRQQLDRELVVVVDGANVVGARPDGWWRDRAGAAVRLRDKLGTLARSGVPAADLGLADGDGWCWWPRVVLVVEGQARHTTATADVEVVAAERDGDTAIVETTRRLRARGPRDHLVVVTADRALRERAEQVGGQVRGPSALLNLLGQAGQKS